MPDGLIVLLCRSVLVFCMFIQRFRKSGVQCAISVANLGLCEAIWSVIVWVFEAVHVEG
jgi:hypothetical protein